MRIHVVPHKDSRKGDWFIHAASENCACYPIKETVISDRDGSAHYLFIHNAFDLREKWERQEVYHESPGWVHVEER